MAILYRLFNIISFYFILGKRPVRHSPRLLGEVPFYLYDIMLTCGISRSNTASGKVITLHNIQSNSDIRQIKKLVIEKVHNSSIRAGFCWVLKGKKECCSLENDADFKKAQQAYTVGGRIKDLRLAVAVIGNSASTQTTKRKLAISEKITDSDSEEDDYRYEKFLKAQPLPSESKKKSNGQWNKIHVNLVRNLEKKGTRMRYGTQHLTLWTNMILEGRISMEEEPQWEKYVDQTDVLPMKNTPGIAPFGRRGQPLNELLCTMMYEDRIARREEMIRRDEERREKEEFERKRREEVEQKYRLDREEERRRSEQFQLSMLMELSPNCRGLAGTENNRSSPIASNPTDSSLLSAGSSILEQTATHVSTNTVINLSCEDAIKLLEEMVLTNTVNYFSCME